MNLLQSKRQCIHSPVSRTEHHSCTVCFEGKSTSIFFRRRLGGQYWTCESLLPAIRRALDVDIYTSGKLLCRRIWAFPFRFLHGGNETSRVACLCTIIVIHTHLSRAFAFIALKCEVGEATELADPVDAVLLRRLPPPPRTPSGLSPPFKKDMIT